MVYLSPAEFSLSLLKHMTYDKALTLRHKNGNFEKTVLFLAFQSKSMYGAQETP